jgi:hypothetical protein
MASDMIMEQKNGVEMSMHFYGECCIALVFVRQRFCKQRCPSRAMETERLCIDHKSHRREKTSHADSIPEFINY